MSEPAKVQIKPKYVAFGILYLAVITVASYFTIEKAFAKSQELSQYQIDKTERFLGEEKAQEMREYIRGEDREDGQEQEHSEQE
jgi:hypothetical protein